MHPGFAIEQNFREIRRRRLHDRFTQITERDHAQRLLDFGQGSHSRRQDDRQAETSEVQQQWRIGQIPRADLQGRDADALDKMRRAVGIERRRHVSNVERGTGSGNALLVIFAQFERAQHLKLGLLGSGRGLLVAQAMDRALSTPVEERQERHQAMLAVMRRNSLEQWRDRFVADLQGG